ncbi:hypothetical protein [Robbsia andropogonis]|nr:hypothetical protein [Robbsia andropogonis]
MDDVEARPSHIAREVRDISTTLRRHLLDGIAHRRMGRQATDA